MLNALGYCSFVWGMMVTEKIKETKQTFERMGKMA